MIFKKIREENAAPKIVLVGNFGAGNFGDELILAGFLKKIGKELPRAKVVVLAGKPKLVRRFHGVDALPQIPTGFRSFWKRGWWRSLRKIREADAIIFPGGGLFSDEESWRAIFLWSVHIFNFAIFLATRFFARPIGRPLRKKMGAKICKILFRKSRVGRRARRSERK